MPKIVSDEKLLTPITISLERKEIDRLTAYADSQQRLRGEVVRMLVREIMAQKGI